MWTWGMRGYLITAAHQVINLMKMAPPRIVSLVSIDFTLAEWAKGQR